MEGLRTLGTLLISNGYVKKIRPMDKLNTYKNIRQFRKLLSDAQILFRDIAGDAAQKAAHRVNPTEDELAQIDRPAQDNVWHDVPDMSQKHVKDQLRHTLDRNKPVHRDDLRQAAIQADDPGHSRDSRDTTSRYGTQSIVDARTGLKTGVDHLRDRAHENIPDEHQDRTKRQWQSTKDYLNDKFHEDRRKQTIWRMKKMVVEIQGHQDYQQAIDTLLSLAENYRGHAKSVAGEGRSQVEAAHEDDHLRLAESQLKVSRYQEVLLR